MPTKLGVSPRSAKLRVIPQIRHVSNYCINLLNGNKDDIGADPSLKVR